MITPRKLDKIDRCRHLLPEPGCQVVGELCVEMRKYMVAIDEKNREIEALQGTLEEFHQQEDAAASVLDKADAGEARMREIDASVDNIRNTMVPGGEPQAKRAQPKSAPEPAGKVGDEDDDQQEAI